MNHPTPRAARKKLLLLEGTLHRLEILEAKDALRSSVANSVMGQRLPGLIGFVFQHKVGALLTSVLPLLLGVGRISRIARRGTLLLGSVAALLGLLRRWNQDRQDGGPQTQDGVIATTTSPPDEKNPGQSRD